MSVYTSLSLAQVQQFADHYGLSVDSITPIQGGIENSNYFVRLSNQRRLKDQQYVLTIFEEINHREAGQLVPVLAHLAVHGIPVANPLTSLDGSVILTLEGKPAQIAPRLPGDHPMQPSVLQVQHMATGLAKLHVALQDYDLQHESAFKQRHGQTWWQQTADALSTTLNTEDSSLLKRVFAEFSTAQADYPQRPWGLIHGDLFRDNTLFIEARLSGVLDFSELSSDELLLDIAICMNDFCSAWPAVALDNIKAHAFIAAYAQVRPLTNDERAILPVYLAMAACRFWLSRLQVAQRNACEGREGEHVLQKNPLEMRDMLKHRLYSPMSFVLA